MRSAACLCLAIFAASAPAFPVPKAAQKPSLGGTEWTGFLNGHTLRLTFREDGTLHHEGAGVAEGAWKLDGNKLTWHVNNYSFYETELNGESMEVHGHNNHNWKADFKLILQSK